MKNILPEIDNDVQTKDESKFNRWFYYSVFRVISHYPK